MNNKTKTLIGILSVFALLPATPALAGWGDFIKQAEEKVKEKAPDLIGSSDSSSPLSANLSTEDIVNGLKEALKIGTQRAVDTVSQSDGYLSNPNIRIPLPENVDKAGELLRKFGLGSTVDKFEESMNLAAEKAAPKAKAVFLSVLDDMSLEDAKKIYQGNDDAATRYFEEKTRGDLNGDFKPLIVDSMNDVGVTKYYQDLVKKAEKYPLVNDLDLNLENYVTDKALDGLFTMLAAEEKAIRENPAARTTDLLKKLFSQ